MSSTAGRREVEAPPEPLGHDLGLLQHLLHGALGEGAGMPEDPRTDHGRHRFLEELQTLGSLRLDRP